MKTADDDLRMLARERLSAAIHKIHRTERDLAAGRPVAARRLRDIHRELSEIRNELGTDTDG